MLKAAGLFKYVWPFCYYQALKGQKTTLIGHDDISMDWYKWFPNQIYVYHIFGDNIVARNSQLVLMSNTCFSWNGGKKKFI